MPVNCIRYFESLSLIIDYSKQDHMTIAHEKSTLKALNTVTHQNSSPNQIPATIFCLLCLGGIVLLTLFPSL